MVAPDDEMRAAEVLANERMQQRFARAAIAHFDRVTGLDHRSLPEIIVDHCLDRPSADIGRNVAGFEFAEHLMDEHTVRNLDCDLDEVFVAAVHRIAGLKRCNRRPAALQKHSPRLSRPNVKVRIFERIFALAQRQYRPRQIDVALLKYFCHTWMLWIGGSIDVLDFQFLIEPPIQSIQVWQKYFSKAT